MAKRIAENREIAGVHYPSDSDASERLASDLTKLISSELDKNPTRLSNLQKTIAASRDKDWGGLLVGKRTLGKRHEWATPAEEIAAVLSKI